MRFELDLDARTLAGWVAGAPAGILFSDLPRGTMFYPAVQFYGDNRTSELVSCKLTLAGGAAEPKAGGGTAGVLPPLWLSDVEPVEFAAIAEVTAGGPVGRAEVAAAVAAAAARAPPATPDTGAAAATAEAVRTASTLSLHGVLVKHGLSTPLVGAAASSTHAATIRLDLGAVNRAAAKRARAESGASAEPRPYDSFEAVVGLADWVYPQVEALPTPGEAAAMHAAAAAAGAWGQWHAYDAHGPAAPAAAAAAAAAEVAAPRIPAASASLDADSKDDDSVLSAIAAPTPDSLPISAGGASGAATVVFRLFCATAGKSAAATPAVAAMRGSPLSAPSLHPHPLAFAASLPPEYAAMHPNMQGEMSCDVCTQTITKSFHCAACGFDVCEACAAKAAGGEAPREIWASPAIHVPAGGASSYAEFARLPLFRVQVREEAEEERSGVLRGREAGCSYPNAPLPRRCRCPLTPRTLRCGSSGRRRGGAPRPRASSPCGATLACAATGRCGSASTSSPQQQGLQRRRCRSQPRRQLLQQPRCRWAARGSTTYPPSLCRLPRTRQRSSQRQRAAQEEEGRAR